MHKLVDGITVLGLIGLTLVLTRPGSQGAALAGTVISGFTGALATAMGATPKGYTSAPTGTGKKR